MRYVWLSQTDEHLAFHNESAQSHGENDITDELQTIGSSRTSEHIDRPQPGPSKVNNISINNAAPELHAADANSSKPIDPTNTNEPPKVPDLPPPKTCLTCLDQIPPGIKFHSSVNDLSLWPPKCCPTTPFSMHVARKILGVSLVNELNERAEELKDKKRVYCCVPDCGAYISMRNRDLMGDLARCEKCGGSMCLLCKSTSHPGKGCRDDEETRKFLELAEREGYRKCKGCGTVCELMGVTPAVTNSATSAEQRIGVVAVL
ncbi:hypothetical protein HII31_13544 [Pseudocercospora fuligena]|uniref:IBR domain-containing protein n=1 Tax=Pseudocercospora fuligena TaxID=685502 RepID=A0A8H6R6G3_9PEZI|nr:hypothetical protein HII31_13544 [Pseudocercospora fuligena]